MKFLLGVGWLPLLDEIAVLSVPIPRPPSLDFSSKHAFTACQEEKGGVSIGAASAIMDGELI